MTVVEQRLVGKNYVPEITQWATTLQILCSSVRVGLILIDLTENGPCITCVHYMTSSSPMCEKERLTHQIIEII